jgi:hypothetical protein
MTMTAQAWDLLGGGFPNEPLQAEMCAIGLTACCLSGGGPARTPARVGTVDLLKAHPRGAALTQGTCCGARVNLVTGAVGD